MIILHSSTTMLSHVNCHLSTGKKLKNYSYSRQIPRWPEEEESMIAQSSGILWLDTHLYTTQATKK